MKQIVLDKLLDIIKFNKNLESVYNTLADLEINGQINSEEYDKNVYYIQLILETINKKLSSLHLDDATMIEIDETLAALNRFDEEGHDLIIDLLELETDNSVRRTMMQIYYLSIETNSGYIIEDAMEVSEEEEEIAESLEEELIESIEEEEAVELMKDKIFASTLLDYIIDYIAKEKNTRIKNELIKVKYRLIYLIKSLEISFVNNPRNFSKTALYQELLLATYKEHESVYETNYTELVKSNVLLEVDYIVNLDDEYYKNIKNKVRAILRSLYIKANLSINYDLSIIDYLKDIYTDALASTKSSISKKNIKESFAIKKELSVQKDVDFCN